LSPRRHACAKLPSRRHPDAAARRGARAPMPRPGRIRASAPPLICPTRISRHERGARITSCSPALKYPASPTQARTPVIHPLRAQPR
jgi:hypothetical protein